MATNERGERITRENKCRKNQLCMTTGSIYANGTLVFTLSGAFLVLVGFVMPYWVTFDHPYPCPSDKKYGVTVYVSIWYGMVCDMDSPTCCRMKGIALQPIGDFKFSQLSGCNAEDLSVLLASGLGGYTLWTAVPIVMSFGLGLLFVAAIMVEVWRCAGYNNRKFVTAICCFLLVGGAAVLAMVILVIVGVTRSFGVPEYKVEVGTFHWSILTSGIGSLLVLIGGILAAIEVSNWKEPSKKASDCNNRSNIVPGSSTHANPGFSGDVTDRFGEHENHGKPREKTVSSSAYYSQRSTDYDVVRGSPYGYSNPSMDNYGSASYAQSNKRSNDYDDGRGGSYGNYGRHSYAQSNQRPTYYDAGRGGSYGNYGSRLGATGQTKQRHYQEPSDQGYYIYSKSSKQRYFPSF